MDNFGIGNGVVGAATAVFIAARRSGRTTQLVENVKNGDRIVFTNTKEANRVKRLCQDRGVTVECIALPPGQPERLFERGTSEGRTIFDHSWVEDYYRLAIERAREEIDHIERQTSGYGEAHREKKRQATEAARWRL